MEESSDVSVSLLWISILDTVFTIYLHIYIGTDFAKAYHVIKHLFTKEEYCLIRRN